MNPNHENQARKGRLVTPCPSPAAIGPGVTLKSGSSVSEPSSPARSRSTFEGSVMMMYAVWQGDRGCGTGEWAELGAMGEQVLVMEPAERQDRKFKVGGMCAHPPARPPRGKWKTEHVGVGPSRPAENRHHLALTPHAITLVSACFRS